MHRRPPSAVARRSAGSTSDPTRRSSAARYGSTPVVRGVVGAQWEWTVTAPDGTVAWSSQEAGARTLTLQGDGTRDATRLTLVVTDPDGPSGDRSSDRWTPSWCPTPHIASFSIDNPTPGLGEVANISADESGLSAGGGDVAVGGRRSTGSPLPFPGSPRPAHRSRCSSRSRACTRSASPSTSGALSDTASVPVTYADRASPRWRTAGSSTCARRHRDGRRHRRRLLRRLDGHARAAPVAGDRRPRRSTSPPARPRWSTASSAARRRHRCPSTLGVVGTPPSDGVVTGARHPGAGRDPGARRRARQPASRVDRRPDLHRRRTRPPATGHGSGPRSPTPTRVRSTCRLTLDGVPGGPAGGYRMLPGRRGPRRLRAAPARRRCRWPTRRRSRCGPPTVSGPSPRSARRRSGGVPDEPDPDGPVRRASRAAGRSCPRSSPCSWPARRRGRRHGSGQPGRPARAVRRERMGGLAGCRDGHAHRRPLRGGRRHAARPGRGRR